MNSICRFIPPIRTHENIQPINFVYESKPEAVAVPTNSSVYKIHLVTEGEGEIRIGDISHRVRRGDIFFIFPSVPYTFIPETDMRYMYISYVGIRAAAEAERLGINRTNFFFPNMDELLPLWSDSIAIKSTCSDLVSEGVLLYSLAMLGRKLEKEDEKAGDFSVSEQNCSLIRKYIDENYPDASLSCEKISQYFSYSKKYVSRVFSKCFGVGISEYINTVRITAACDMIDRGYTSVSEISNRVGFRDPLYFSKVFKQKTGYSPKKYMSEHKKRSSED